MIHLITINIQRSNFHDRLIYKTIFITILQNATILLHIFCEIIQNYSIDQLS